MTTSVLESDYKEPEDRPYSQKELCSTLEKFFGYMRIGKTCAQHKMCNHVYRVKINGRKEKEILETKNNDTGNCSVCWKFSKTQRFLKNKAENLINSYIEHYNNNEEYKTFEGVDLEIAFYKWLYEEIN